MNRAGTSAETTTGREWPTRLTVVLLFFFSSFICYMDRINISVTILQMDRRICYDRGGEYLRNDRVESVCDRGEDFDLSQNC